MRKKEGLGEKCTQKKKESRNQKIGHVRRSLEKKFEQSESERLLHREIWYLQVGFFFLSIYSSNWGDCNLVSQGSKPLDPNLPSHFFLLPNTPKYYFIFYFFPSFLKSTQPSNPIMKSHPFLSTNGILE